MPVIKDPAIRDRNSMLFYGCCEAEAINLNDGLPLRQKGTPAYRYYSQRHSAHARGIGWEITFREWLSVWIESGHLNERGVGIGGYCMARHGDQGPYKVGNVSIQTVQQNSRDGIEKARPAINARASRAGHSGNLGLGRGWTYRDKGVRRYQVLIADKYVGCFLTQEEAEAAYRAAVAERHVNRSVDGVTE